MPDPSHICNLHRSSRQPWIPNRARPGIEPTIPGFLVGFVSTVPQWECLHHLDSYRFTFCFSPSWPSPPSLHPSELHSAPQNCMLLKTPGEVFLLLPGYSPSTSLPTSLLHHAIIYTSPLQQDLPWLRGQCSLLGSPGHRCAYLWQNLRLCFAITYLTYFLFNISSTPWAHLFNTFMNTNSLQRESASWDDGAFKSWDTGFPSWLSANEPIRIWVQSLASLNGLRIRRCHELFCRSQILLGSNVAVAVVKASSCSSDSTSSLGTSISCTCGPKQLSK